MSLDFEVRKMTKNYPNLGEPIFEHKDQTFEEIGVKFNPSLEGIPPTREIVSERTDKGVKKLISLEFNWLPRRVVKAYNATKDPILKKQVLVKEVYGNCKLNCKGCYVKQDGLFENNDLLFPDQIMDIIEEAVNKLGTRTIKYLGPSEFFRDKDVFEYLDRFDKMGVILNVFIKDPMFGDDKEVEEMFGDTGIKTSEQFVERLAKYKNLRLLYNFRSFDEELTNDLVRGGYKGKKDYDGNYKKVQNRSLQLIYKHFVKQEIEKGKEGRLVIINTPIVAETMDEAFEIFKYFTERGIPVCSTTSMQSGCGKQLYESHIDDEFIDRFAKYYAQAIDLSIRRGVITQEYLEEFGPSPYAGVAHCMQLCNGLLIRSTGQLIRCPGADHEEWRDNITPEQLINEGIAKLWPYTKNHAQEPAVNIGCLAKSMIFNKDFNRKVMQYYNELKK